MMERFNGYRTQTLRLQGWNYKTGSYFITINIKNRKKILSYIEDSEVKLTKLGAIIDEEWQNTAHLRKSVKIDEYIIMPDHFHAILSIQNETGKALPMAKLRIPSPKPCQGQGGNNFSPKPCQRQGGNFSPKPCQRQGNNFSPKPCQRQGSTRFPGLEPNSLGSIINHFKAKTTKRIRQIAPSFAWQANYFERIIRDKRAMENIRRYIRENPKKAKEEK